MAHGFLTPQEVAGESPLFGQLAEWLQRDSEKKDRQFRVINARVEEIQNKLGAGQVPKLPPGAQKMLGGSTTKLLTGSGASAIVPKKAGIVSTAAKTAIVGRNATNIDRKEQKYLGTSNPDLAGGPSTRKGGAFTDFGSTAQAKPLSDSNFFSKAVNEGIDASTGEYLSKSARIAAFQAGRVNRDESGVDIVAAINRNTQAIVALTALTKDQTSKQVAMHNEREARDERRANRALARAEERQLEGGSDLSGYLTPSGFKSLSPGSGRRGPNIGDIARTAGGFVNSSTYKAGGSAYKAGSTALKTLRSGGPKLLSSANNIVPATVKTVDTALKPIEATNAMQKMVKGGGAVLGKAESAGKIASSLGKTFAGTGIKKKLSLGAAGAGLGEVIEATVTNVDPKDAKALAATRKALPAGAGLSVLGDEGLGMITNSPEILKTLDKVDDASDGAATAKAVATAADAGATKAGLLAFLKGRKPKGLVRGSAFTRMMLRNPAGKMFLKKLPLIGAIAGGVFAVQRLMEGDFLGAGLELGSGILGATGMAPASLALDGLLLARDFGAVPFAKGGIITEPTNALMGEAGAEGVFPLEGSKGKKTFEMFGDAFVDAQVSRKKEVAQVQAEGFRLFAKDKLYMKVFDFFNPFKNRSNDNTPNSSPVTPMVGPPPPPPVGGGRKGGTSLNSTGAKGVLDVIASVESNGNYDVFNTARGGTPGKATEKTIGWLAKNAQGAIGRYQHMPEFILERAARFGYDANTRFTPEVQDDITIKMMQEQHGLDDFLSGNMSAATFAAKLAPTWRGLPQGRKAAQRLGGTADSTYMDQYSSGNKAHMSWADSVSNFERIQAGAGKIENYDPNKKYKAGDMVIKNGEVREFDGMGWARPSGVSAQNFEPQASNPNTGTPIMATSAQVARAGAATPTPTIINNYYTTADSSGGGVNPNGVSAGIGMNDTGTAAFTELRLRTLA